MNQNINNSNKEQETAPEQLNEAQFLQSPIQTRHQLDEEDTNDNILIDHLSPVREEHRDYSPFEDQQSKKQEDDQQVTIQNKKVADTDLKKRINLFYHPLDWRIDYERQNQDQSLDDNPMMYYQWARFNMHRSHEIASGVQFKLKQLYENAPEYDERLNQLFPDFDTQVGTNFIRSHIDKLDKNLQNLSKATTQFMSTFYKQNVEDRSGKKKKVRDQSPVNSGYAKDNSLQTLTRQEKENLIEQRVLDAAPRYLEHGKLQQIRETSFLILNQKRLPVFGRAASLFPRELRSGVGGAPPIRLLPDRDTIKQEIIIQRAGNLSQQYDENQRLLSAGQYSNQNANLSAGKQTTGNIADSQVNKVSSFHARKGSQQLPPASQGDVVKNKKGLRGSSSQQISKLNAAGPLAIKQPSGNLYPLPSHSNVIQATKKKPVEKNSSNVRLISPISKTDYSGGGVSSSGIQLASGTFDPPKDIKDMVVIEAKKKKKKQQQNNQISITVPAEKLQNRVLTNYDKPLITGISPDTSIEQAKFTSSGMIQSINEKDFNKVQSRGPPLNATASQFNGQLAVSPNLINEQTLKAIYDKYLERSPKQGLENNISPQQLIEQYGNNHPLSMESLRLALQQADGKGNNSKNFRTGNSSDFNGIKLAQILREQGLLIDRTEDNAAKPISNFSQPLIKPIQTQKISEDDKKSSGKDKKRLMRTDANQTDQTHFMKQQQLESKQNEAYSSSGYKQFIQPGGITGSSNFQFLRGLQDRRNKFNNNQLPSSQQNDVKATTKNEQTQNEGLTTLSQDENEKTARRMELIRMMLYKFRKQKEQGVDIAGAENLLADYGSKAELFPQNKTAYYLTLGKNATANEARQNLASYQNKSPQSINKTKPQRASPLQQQQWQQQEQQKFQVSPPKAKKIREQIKYGIKPAWKSKFYPHDILNKKFYQNNISNYGRIMKKRIPKQAKYMSQTIRNQYTMDKQFQREEFANDYTLSREPNYMTRQQQYRSITQKSQEIDPGSIQPSPQFADYQMYGYGPRYQQQQQQQTTSPNAVNKQLQMMMQPDNNKSRKAIPLSNYAVVQSLSLQSSSPRLPVQLQSQQQSSQFAVKQSTDEIVNGVPQSAMQDATIGGQATITQTSGFEGGSAMMMMMMTRGGQQAKERKMGQSNIATIGQLSSSVVNQGSKQHQGQSLENTIDRSQLPQVSSSQVNLPYVAMITKKNANIDAQEISNSQNQFKSQQLKNNTQFYQEEQQEDNNNEQDDSPLKRMNFQNVQSKYQPTPYDIEEYEHLFPHGRIPQSLKNIIDPLQFNYLLVKLKKDFNQANRSKFLGYMKIHFPEYVSRRDELGGIINQQDYYLFSKRLGMLFQRVSKKRSKLLRRKKRKHLKKLIPKSLIKNPVGPRMEKDPVWRSIFIHPDMGKKRIQYETMKGQDEQKRPFYLPPLSNKSSIV